MTPRKYSLIAIAASVALLVLPTMLAAQNTYTITAPNGTENWVIGDKHPIHWDCTADPAQVKLQYSTNSGSSWIQIAATSPNDGSYLWTMPATPSATSLVRVSTAGTPGEFDVSDGDFSIRRQAIRISRPESAGVYVMGAELPIHWTSTGDISSVKIDYSTDGGTSWSPVVGSSPNDGVHAWAVPAGYSSNCRVRVADASDAGTFGTSAPFSIVRPTCTDITPKGGEQYYNREKHPIHWAWDWPGGISGVKLEYSTNAGSSWTVIIANSPNDGCYAWTVPARADSQYRVRISDANDPLTSFASIVNFRVRSDSVRESLHVLSPQASDFWTAGQGRCVTWGGRSTATTVKLDYSTDGGTEWHAIVSSTDNDGDYDWVVPDTVGTDCRVRVSNTLLPSTAAISEMFTIRHPEVAVVSPIRGDAWLVGRAYLVAWKVAGGFTSARIDYSTDAGATWNAVVTSTENDGSYEWLVPNTIGDSCLVRVSDADDPLVYGTSETFRIRAPGVTVTSPRQDDIWWVGRDYFVSWTWQGGFSKVRVEYSTNGGSTWIPIVDSSDNDGEYLWRLPPPTTRNGRVRIINSSNAATADTSDEFEIHMTGIESKDPIPAVPEKTGFSRVSPNPTNGGLAVSYQIARAGPVRMSICDIAGRTVRVLSDGEAVPGRYTVRWDGCDDRRRSLAAGVYLCVLEAGGTRAAQRLTIVR